MIDATGSSGAGERPGVREQALQHLVDLLRIDSTNDGTGSGPGEREAAEHCAGVLADAGLDPQVHERSARRSNVVARLPGRDPERPALLLNGHLDTVPATAAEWSVDPFSGEVRDGCVWGRGAVDMKDMVAMTLAVVAERSRAGRPPARDVVVAFFADEEAGSYEGSRWMASEHADLFAGCTEAVSEVGGFSVTGPTGRRGYLLETACKGVAYVRAVARGRPGHGSLLHEPGAVAELAAALVRVGEHVWPASEDPLARRMTQGLSLLLGAEVDPAGLRDALTGTTLEPLASMLASSVRHTLNPTVLQAGGIPNVVPSRAEAILDGRFLPGGEEGFLDDVRRLLGPGIAMDLADHAVPLDSPHEGPVLDAMAAALQAADPGAVVVPYCNTTSSDNAFLAPLGIAGYGFVPLRLPADFQFARMFHGIDERIPVESLAFGVDVLDDFLDRC